MAKNKVEEMCNQNHHYIQIMDNSLTAHTLQQFQHVSAKPPKFICTQCGKVISA